MPGWPWWLRRSHGTEQPQPGYKRKRLYSTLCPSRVPGRALQPLAGGGLAKFQRSASAPAQPARGKPPPWPLQLSGRWASCQREVLGSSPGPQLHSWAPHALGLQLHGLWCPGVPSTPHTGLRGGDPFLPIPSHPNAWPGGAPPPPSAPPRARCHPHASTSTCSKAGGLWGPPTPQPLPSLSLCPPSLPELLRAAERRGREQQRHPQPERGSAPAELAEG